MADRKKGHPILPRDANIPTGTADLQRSASADFARRLRRVQRGWISLLDDIPVSVVVNARYNFDINQVLLSRLLDAGSALIDDELLEGGEFAPWFFEQYVAPAYARGTAQEFANLASQAPEYLARKGTAQELLVSPPYQRRLVLLRAREFEEMKGLSGGVKADMSRVLTDGVARGLNPRDIAKNLSAQTSIDIRRARRIARTEITTALKRARMDEADDAEEDLGLKSLQMHVSSFGPTSRKTHMRRHGGLFTTDQQRDWYSVDANAIDCQCSTITVLVGPDGKPLVPEIVERAKQTARVMIRKRNIKL